MAIRAAVGMNLPPGDARFEPGDPITDEALAALGAETVADWIRDGNLADTEPEPEKPKQTARSRRAV